MMTNGEVGDRKAAAGIDLTGHRQTDAEKRRQRARSIAIAVALAALVALFYAVTIVKIGGNILASRV
jgi:hypothetical protein